MSDSDLGLTESVAIALGGMIGGGIYAVLGVVAGITRGATWAAFVLAGIVTTGAGYSSTSRTWSSASNPSGPVPGRRRRLILSPPS